MVNTAILSLGLTLVGLVAAKLGMGAMDSLRESAFRKQHRLRALQLLQESIMAIQRQRESDALAWNGFRKFVVVSKREEAADIQSFLLAPHDGKPLPPFKPGQYLTFRLTIPGREKPTIRCYSLSDCPQPDQYRIAVKQTMAPDEAPHAPPGLVSSFFHEQVCEGDILDVQAPRGGFAMNPEDMRPAVLIAGGVGITPLLSMMSTVAALNTGRELLLFYGVRNGEQHAFKEQLDSLAHNNANIRVIVCYSQPEADDLEHEGIAYQHDARITTELMRSYLQSCNYSFYLCGPPQMMKSLTDQLITWGAAKQDIFMEAFGPATVSVNKANSSVRGQDADGAPRSADTCQVTFERSGKKCGWNNEQESLLQFALVNGVHIDSGCRAGNCGTCVVAVKSGEVQYLTEHGAELEDGTCLSCIAVPDGDLVIDA